MTYRKPAAELHPLPYGTQARACSVEHGWIFGPVVWRHKTAENGNIYIYTVQDEKNPNRTTDVASFSIETQQPECNRIVEVNLRLMENGHWEVAVRKTFAPEYGGGEQWFKETSGPEIHFALDVAKRMVTASPAQRSVA